MDKPDQIGRGLVLLVDDDTDQREMYGLYLRARGFLMLAATNRMQAMALARQVRPDVIIMDLAMPNLNGWEATQRSKHDPLTRSIPVIACTAHTGEWAVNRAVEAGCDAYLTKPCLPRDLVAEIRRVMTLSAPDDRPASPERPAAPRDVPRRRSGRHPSRAASLARRLLRVPSVRRRRHVGDEGSGRACALIPGLAGHRVGSTCSTRCPAQYPRPRPPPRALPLTQERALVARRAVCTQARRGVTPHSGRTGHPGWTRLRRAETGGIPWPRT